MPRKKYDEYAFTVSDNRTDVTDYRSFFSNAEKLGCEIVNKFKELDSKKRPHYHGIIRIPRSLYRKELCLEGLHLKLVYDFDGGWMRYCRKMQPDPNVELLQVPPEEDLIPPKKSMFKDVKKIIGNTSKPIDVPIPSKDDFKYIHDMYCHDIHDSNVQ